MRPSGGTDQVMDRNDCLEILCLEVPEIERYRRCNGATAAPSFAHIWHLSQALLAGLRVARDIVSLL